MSTSIQNYISNILNSSPNGLFLDLHVLSNLLDSVSNNECIILGQRLVKIFLIADIVLYVGIIFVIWALGSGYSKIHSKLGYQLYPQFTLTRRLVNVSAIFIYLSLIINLYGLVIGLDFLSSHTLLIFDRSYSISLFSQMAKLVLLFLTGALYSIFTCGSATNESYELPLLIQISVALGVTILSSFNFALLLLALEGFSLLLYIMTALGRTYGGVTAAVKYFAFGTLGSIFLFWGVVHIYALIPSLNFDAAFALSQYINAENSDIRSSFEFATTAITFGFVLKLGAAPAHQWVADVYAGSPMFITAFFSIVVKFLLFIVFLKIGAQAVSDSLLKIFILSSLIVGCVMSLRQTEIKRLLAYSSIVHVAFLLMGDSNSSVIYLLTYILSSLLIFSVLLRAEIAEKEIIYLNDLRFLRDSNMFQVSCFTIALASSAGLPPFAGFYGKFMVWSSLIEDIYLNNNIFSYFALFVSIIISLLTIYYYMRVLAYIFVGEDSRAQYAVTYAPSATTAFQLQLGLLIAICFWTFFQSYILGVVQHITL